MKTLADLFGLDQPNLYCYPAPASAEKVAIKHRIDELHANASYGARYITMRPKEDELAKTRTLTCPALVQQAINQRLDKHIIDDGFGSLGGEGSPPCVLFVEL